jgi:hypothetical protein
MRLSKKRATSKLGSNGHAVHSREGLPSEKGRGLLGAMHGGCKRLDTSTQGEYANLKAAYENLKDFNVSKRQSQILPLRPAFQKISRLSPQLAPQLRLCGAAFCQDQAARRDLRAWPWYSTARRHASRAASFITLVRAWLAQKSANLTNAS